MTCTCPGRPSFVDYRRGVLHHYLTQTIHRFDFSPWPCFPIFSHLLARRRVREISLAATWWWCKRRKPEGTGTSHPPLTTPGTQDTKCGGSMYEVPVAGVFLKLVVVYSGMICDNVLLQLAAWHCARLNNEKHRWAEYLRGPLLRTGTYTNCTVQYLLSETMPEPAGSKWEDGGLSPSAGRSR